MINLKCSSIYFKELPDEYDDYLQCPVAPLLSIFDSTSDNFSSLPTATNGVLLKTFPASNQRTFPTDSQCPGSLLPVYSQCPASFDPYIMH